MLDPLRPFFKLAISISDAWTEDSCIAKSTSLCGTLWMSACDENRAHNARILWASVNLCGLDSQLTSVHNDTTPNFYHVHTEWTDGRQMTVVIQQFYVFFFFVFFLCSFKIYPLFFHNKARICRERN